LEQGEEEKARCVVGRDYRAPIVDRAAACEQTLTRYAEVKKSPV